MTNRNAIAKRDIMEACPWMDGASESEWEGAIETY